MKYINYIISLTLLAACNKTAVKQPLWINKSNNVSIQNSVLSFTSAQKNWNVSLYSFTQPIPLQKTVSDTGFSITINNKNGIVEGPAKLMLENNGHFFYYDLNLVNTSSTNALRDYRSPKTVNPDSALVQQSITHFIDENRNIGVENEVFFKEVILKPLPKVSTKRAIANEPLTAHYVQAGSAKSIVLSYQYAREKKLFNVSTAPLYDKYENLVSNGTLVSFIYTSDTGTSRVETTVINGTANVYIPYIGKVYNVYAKINETISNTITLTP